MTKVYILILNYKKHLDTQKCLNSLLRSDLPKASKIIVLDNSSTDTSVKYLRGKFPKLTIIKNKRNLGFAGGNNVGLRLALKNSATHVLILNPDTIVPRHFLKPLLKNLKKTQAGLIAPALEHYPKGQKFFGLEGSVDYLGRAIHVNLPRIESPAPRPAQFVTFACVLIDTKVFKRVGLLDSGYFMYLEDVDYCLRARQKRFKIILDPSVIVKHTTSSSFKKPTDKLLLSFRSQLRFLGRWTPYPRRLLAYLFTFLFYPYLYLLWTYHSFKYARKDPPH